MNPVLIDTSQVATDTIAYVATDQHGLTATSTRTVIIDAANDNTAQATEPAANDNTSSATTTPANDNQRLFDLAILRAEAGLSLTLIFATQRALPSIRQLSWSAVLRPVMFKTLLAAWEPYTRLTAPPDESVRLWASGGCGVWISNSWGPSLPYPPIVHPDGNKNHRYRHIKGNPTVLDDIPEVNGWPELRRFLQLINSVGSPIESVGCEKGFFPVEGLEGPKLKLGSYVEVIFTNVPLNEHPENFLHLASMLASSVENCERWWGDVSLVLERFKFIAGATDPWGMMFQIKSYGRNEEEARQFWGESLKRLGTAIAALPTDFPERS